MFGIDGFNIIGLSSIGSVGGIFSFIITAFIIAILCLIVFLPVFFYVYLKTFKWKITIRENTGSKIVIKSDKGKIIKDKDGVRKLKLLNTPKLFRGDYIAIPPDDAVLITKKGQFYVDVYKTNESQYIWAIDEGLNKPIKYKEGASVSNFIPMNTMDRSWYADEWQNAEKHKKKSILETVEHLAPWIIIFMIFTILIVNWDSIAKPALESQKESQKMQKALYEYQKDLQKTAAIIHGVQIVEEDKNEKE